MRKTDYFPAPLLFLLCLFLFLTPSCFSQNSGPDNFWSKVRFGGGIGLGFGNGSFSGALSPSALYEFNDYFATGAGLTINYSKFRESKLLAYGGSVLTLFNPIPAVQLSAEFEQLRVNRELEVFNGSNVVEDNYWLPALYMGIGFGSRNVTVGVRYDVLYDTETSLYADPWAPFVRVYF
ncbi:alpha-ketoglutarate decarboxylase [Flavobacteriaceae bacterium 3-367]